MSQKLIDFMQTFWERPPEQAFDRPNPSMFVREAVGLLCWGTMQYRCDTCGHEWSVWLALGVEGPTQLKEAGLYVPSPFSTGPCRAWPLREDATEQDRKLMSDTRTCNGTYTHVTWHNDVVFSTPEMAPDDAPRFALSQAYDYAELVIPTDALVAARRYHKDKQDLEPQRPSYADEHGDPGGYGGES